MGAAYWDNSGCVCLTDELTEGDKGRKKVDFQLDRGHNRKQFRSPGGDGKNQRARRKEDRKRATKLGWGDPHGSVLIKEERDWDGGEEETLLTLDCLGGRVSAPGARKQDYDRSLEKE